MFKNPKSNTLPLSQNTLKLPSMIKRWASKICLVVVALVRLTHLQAGTQAQLLDVLFMEPMLAT